LPPSRAVLRKKFDKPRRTLGIPQHGKSADYAAKYLVLATPVRAARE